MKNHFILIVLLFILSNMKGYTQIDPDSIPLRTYTTTQTNNPPRIDGILDDDCWLEGEWQGDFLQQQPNEGHPPSSPTEIKILYNTNYLYVAFRCYDIEPDKINHNFTSRDNFGGDMAGIALDSYEDKKTAFEFNVSAAGQKVDLKHKGDFEFDQNWNAVWDVKTAMDESAWTAEMRIPFSQLRYSDKEEQHWGMHIWRWIDRKNEESQWKLIPVNAPAMVYIFGKLNGIKDIRSSRQIEFLPYTVAKYSPKRGDNTNPYGNTREYFLNGGFDAKIGLSSNFTLDATINPDFGQVEADPSVLNLSAYETLYDEKRPFFLESREIFDYTINDDRIYHSRRIGQAPGFVPDISGDHYLETPQNSTILGAAKITGKTSKGMSVGIIESITSAEYSKLYRPDEETKDTLAHPYSNFFVARIMQEKNGGNTIFGGIFTSTQRINPDNRIDDLLHRNAYTGGVDFEQNFSDKTYFIGGKFLFSQLQGSQNAIQALQESNVHLYQRPDADFLSSRYDTTSTSLSGTGGYIEGGKKGGKWRLNEKFRWLSPGFDLNDVGYLRQADVIAQSTEIEFRENEPHKFSRSYELSLAQSTSMSYSGELVHAGINFGASNQFKNLWGIRFNWNASFPSLETRELRGGPALWVNGENEWAIHMNSNQSKDLNFNGGIHFTSVQNEPSKNTLAHIALNWHPISRIRISPFILYSVNQDEYQYINPPDNFPENRYFLGSLDQQTLEFTLRAEFFLSPEISLQFYGSPFYSVGHYSHFHYVNEADSKKADERYHTYISTEISDLSSENNYSVEESATGMTYSFENPDFMFGQIRTNLVFRWEYKLGSVLHLVWSHNKSDDDNINTPSLSDNYTNLNTIKGDNIFLIKLNYWFSL